MNTDAIASAAEKASSRNAGWPATCRQLRARAAGCTGVRFSGGWVSGNSSDVSSTSAAPSTTSMPNTLRQPSATCTQPPMMGATAGAMREHQHHAAHQALRVGAVEGIAHHGARHGGPDARRHALQHAADQQRAEGGRQEAADGADGVEHQAADHHLAASQRIGQRTVHQRKAGKGQQVGSDDLLHLPGC